ncbi:MAG: hypothetical protein KatS3mg015_1938 [Fimbriimonadales bacterium]|nr:MAG: hypothetical protein KatS3mg015_1938 [Fimbriimonadales bacterium]
MARVDRVISKSRCLGAEETQQADCLVCVARDTDEGRAGGLRRKDNQMESPPYEQLRTAYQPDNGAISNFVVGEHRHRQIREGASVVPPILAGRGNVQHIQSRTQQFSCDRRLHLHAPTLDNCAPCHHGELLPDTVTFEEGVHFCVFGAIREQRAVRPRDRGRAKRASCIERTRFAHDQPVSLSEDVGEQGAMAWDLHLDRRVHNP